jgi:hypothetical protein
MKLLIKIWPKAWMQLNSEVDTGPAYLAWRKMPKYHKMGPARRAGHAPATAQA